MFGRRRDIQIPKVPVSGDKATQSWMTAVGSMLSKYIGGGSDDRLVSAKELIDGGLAGIGTGGFLTLPPKNLTKPPKVSGLTANGAFAAIYVQWNNPSFSNYSHTELWRADVDDIGVAVLIASTAVESYIDNVGSAATKYYWARAVSDQGVKGDFNASAGTKGETSFNPDYVKQILTSLKWQANTTYAPYQYVQPTTENGFQYVVIDGGKSASVEPTWPTTVGLTVSDGTVEWKCVAATDRLPLVIGQLENGDPAVFIDTAFIKNASITSAKIGDLVADKITTGDLNADLHVLSKLWYGFNLPNGDFLDPENNTITSGKSGFYLGVNGSNGFPVLHLNTGIANGSRSLYFDGTQLKIENVDILSSSDGTFDDLKGDSVNFERASFDLLAFGEHVTASQYVYDNNIKISEPEFKNYLCYPNGSRLTNDWLSNELILGTGYSRPFAFFQTGVYSGIFPYDYSNNATKYRANKKKIGFSILVDAPQANSVGNYYTGSYLDIYIFSENQNLPSTSYNASSATSGIPSEYLLKIPVTYHSNGSVTAYKNTGSGDVSVFDVDVVIDKQLNDRQTLVICKDDLEVLGYQVGRQLKVAVVFKSFFQAGGSDDTTGYGQIKVWFQLHSIAGEENVPDSDADLSLIPTAGQQQQFLILSANDEAVLRRIIRDRIIADSRPDL